MPYENHQGIKQPFSTTAIFFLIAATLFAAEAPKTFKSKRFHFYGPGRLGVDGKHFPPCEKHN